MATKTVTFVWKIARPTNEGFARALMAAAYKTAMETDPNTTQVLIRRVEPLKPHKKNKNQSFPPFPRSRIHKTTFTGNQYKQDDPHITIATKNPQTETNGTHQASHGYTADLTSEFVVRVKASGFTKADSYRDVWPQGLPQEEGGGPELGQGFVTWESEEKK